MPLCTRKTLLSFCLAASLILPGAVVHAKEGDETSAPESRQEEQSNPVVNTDNLVEPSAEAADTAPRPNVFYKSKDAKGNITYTDKPPANSVSEALKMPSTNTMPMSEPVNPVRRENNQDNDHGDEQKGPVEYTRFEIASPANDAVLGQDVETVTISVALEPGLQDGHQLQLFYDGKPVGASGDLSFTVEGLERGTHTAEAKILGDKKQVLKSTAKVQFYVYRHSILDGKGKLKDPNNKVPPPVPQGSMSGFDTGKGLDTTGKEAGGDKEAKTPEGKPIRGIQSPTGAKAPRGF